MILASVVFTGNHSLIVEFVYTIVANGIILALTTARRIGRT